MSTRAQFLRNTLLLLVALVLLNVLAQRFKFRADLTGDHRYTLSKETLKMLHDLPEAVTVSAYFTENMPPDLAIARQDFKDLLVEFAARSDGNLVFEFADPSDGEAVAELARKEGVKPLLAQTRDKDKAENMQVYMGAVVRMGERKAVIPALQQGAGMEWTLASAIHQASVADKPVIGILQGHREPSVRSLDQLAIALNALYDVEPMAIYDTFPVNERFTSVLVIDPQDSIPPRQLQRLQEYMGKGHGVVVAYGAVQADLNSSPVADMRHIGLEPWLARLGVGVEQKIIADAKCGQVQVMQNGMPFPVPMNFPYFPLIDHFTDHPVARGVDVVLFQFAAPLAFTGDTSIQWSPIMTSGDHGQLLDAPYTIALNRPWSDADFPLGPQTVGGALEGTLGTQDPRAPGNAVQRSRMVVFSNGSFCTSTVDERPVQLPKGNLDLMVNAVDWVTHNTGLLELRGKEVGYRPIDQLSDARRASLKWINLLLPVACVVIYGLFRAQWRRRQRKLRMRPGHVR